MVVSPMEKQPLLCAECEKAEAQLVCIQESLLYCQPCSRALHSKRARAHHCVLPLLLCDQCEITPASLHCPNCALHFCPPCSNLLHSKKARAHHTVQPYCHRQKDPLPAKKKSEDESSSSVEIISPSRKKPRRTNPQRGAAPKFNKDENYQSQSDSSDTDDDDTDDETYGIHRIKRGAVSLEAFIVDADDEEEDDGPGSEGQAERKAQTGVQERIRKMLELGLHPDTPDMEAQQALRNAQRLLTKHNLQQAEVMKGEIQNTEGLAGGLRMVELRSKEGKKSHRHGRIEQWIYNLASLIAEYFDTDYFAQSHRVLRIVFYGIKQNANCAGYAFAATFNRITKLSADYIPSKINDESCPKEGKKGRAVSSALNRHTRVARSSYRNGIIAGLEESVKQARRRQKCNKENKSEGSKSEGTKSPNEYSETDCMSDVDTEFSEGEVSDEKPSRAEREEEKCNAIWALSLHSKKVGAEFLKQKGIKVRTRTTHGPSNRNEEAFAQGKKDAKVINIDQKGIKAGSRSRKA